MLCPHCGAEIVTEGGFCPKCGASLNTANAQASADPSPANPQAGSVGKERFQAMRETRSDSSSTPQVVLWTGTFSRRAMLDNWVFCGLATIGLAALGLSISSWKWKWQLLLMAIVLLWVYNFILYISRRLGVRYQLTSHRFIHERGILHHVSDRVDLVQIEDLQCEQSLSERMLGIGTIRIISRDSSSPDLIVHGIDDAKGVAAKIDEARRAEQMQRGLLME